MSSDVSVIQLLQSRRAATGDWETGDWEAIATEVRHILEKDSSLLEEVGPDGHRATHIAANLDAKEVLKVLIEMGADINALDAQNQTPLNHSVFKDSGNCFSMLIEGGANINANSSKTSLQHAVEVKSEFMVDKLLDNGAKISCKASKITPIHYSAEKGYTNILERLLKSYPKKVNICTQKRVTPLHLAAEKGNPNCCKVLIDNGAEVNSINNERLMPLHLAVKSGYKKTCELLIKSGADIGAKDALGRTPMMYSAACKIKDSLDILELLLENCKDVDEEVNKVDKNHLSALHYAVKHSSSPDHRELYAEKCRQLIIKGANCNLLDADKKSPLHYATKNRDPACCSALLNLSKSDEYYSFNDTLSLNGADELDFLSVQKKYQADYHVEIDIKDKDGNAPIHYALKRSSIECCHLLLKCRANINITNHEGDTPLHIAAENKLEECCQKFIYKGAHPGIPNNAQETPLHIAAKYGSLPCCQILQKGGANVNAKGFKKKTPIYFAIQAGAYECVSFLLKRNAHYKIQDDEGNTPLHFAASEGQLECCKHLASMSSKNELLYIKNSKGKLPLTIAFEKGYDEIFEFLLLKEDSLMPNKNMKENICSDIQTFVNLKREHRLSEVEESIKNYSDKKNNSDKNVKRTRSKPILQPQSYYDIENFDLSNPMETAVDSNRKKAVNAIVKSNCWRLAFKSIEVGKMNSNFNKLIEKFPDQAKIVLDKCIGHHGDGSKTYIFVHLDPTYFMPNLKVETMSFDNSWVMFDEDGKLEVNAIDYYEDERIWRENHPLYKMAKLNRIKLLQHPLCLRFLDYKWENYLEHIFFCILAIASFFAVSLSLYANKACDWHHMSRTYNLSQDEVCNVKSSFCESTRNGECQHLDMAYSTFENSSCKDASLLSLIGIATITSLMLNVVVDVKLFYTLGRNFSFYEVGPRILTYIATLIFIVPWTECTWNTGIREEWQWICGTGGVLLSWFKIILLLGMTPSFSDYILLIQHFFRTGIWLVVLLSLLVAAFSSSFQMLMRGNSAFSHWSLSIMKMITMMMGDLGYDDLFNNNDNPLPYPVSTHLLLIFFLILMCIVTINLINNFPQEQLDKVKEETKRTKLSNRSIMMLEFDSLLPSLRRYFSVGWITDNCTFKNEDCETYLENADEYSENCESNPDSYTAHTDMNIFIKEIKNSHEVLKDISLKLADDFSELRKEIQSIKRKIESTVKNPCEINMSD